MKIILCFEGSAVYCDGMFAMLSAHGEIFAFSMLPGSTDSILGRDDHAVINPQKVWSMRKPFDPAKDVVLGSNGKIIVCTESGHIFMWSPYLKGSTGSKSLKFHCILHQMPTPQHTHLPVKQFIINSQILGKDCDKDNEV